MRKKINLKENLSYICLARNEVFEEKYLRELKMPVFIVDGSENVTGLDLSDFPALADRNRREGSGNPTPLINPLAGRAPYGKAILLKALQMKWNFLDSPFAVTKSIHCLSKMPDMSCYESFFKMNN